MSPILNIVDAFLFQARHQPTALALCVPGSQYSTVSYGRLAMMTNNIATRGVAAGLKRGDVVAVASGDPVLHLALILGLTMIGAVTLSAGSRRLPGEFRIDGVVTDVAGTFHNVGRVITADATWPMGAGTPPPVVPDVRTMRAAAVRAS